MKKYILVLTLTLIPEFLVYAGSVDSGCGLVSIVISRNSKLLQIIGVTTNVYISGITQTFAISSGTSNCTAHGFVKSDYEKIYYANANTDALVTEMASGNGEHLQEFAHIYGCGSDAYPKFQEAAQKQIPEIMNSPSGVSIINQMNKAVGSDPILSTSCKTLI